MTWVHDLFVSFTLSNSSMYEELGRRTRHLEHIYEAMIFQMESGGVLRVENVPWVLGVCSQPHRMRSRDMQCCSGMDK
jgi:hypothetical protein